MPLTSAVFRFASFHVFVFFVWNLRSNLLCHSVSHLLIFHILQTVFCCVSCISTHCFVHSTFVVALPLPPPLALPHTLRCFVTQHSVSDLYVIASLSAPTPPHACCCHTRHYGRFPFPFVNLYRNCWAIEWLDATLRCSGCCSHCWCSCSMLQQRTIQVYKVYKVVALQVSTVSAVNVAAAVKSAFQSLCCNRILSHHQGVTTSILCGSMCTKQLCSCMFAW